MQETDVIGHLIEIENQAAAMLLEAQSIADGKVAEARQNAENQYKAGYEALVSKLEKDFQQNSTKILSEYDEKFAAYKNNIEQLPKDTVAFNSLFDSLLFGK